MWKGREIVFCAGALFIGNMLGDFLMPSPAVCLATSFLFATASLVFRKAPVLLVTFIALGAASLQIDRMPPKPHQSALEWRTERIKSTISGKLEEMLPEGCEETGIFKALAIGDKSSIGKDLKNAYRKSGAMHLLALSGLHVGLIYALMSFILGILGGSKAARMSRSILILAFLWQFALISGLSASIFRAVLMISFYEISGFISAERDGPAALAGSAIVIMLLQPESPRELSFQLSYSAVIGIFAIYPRLSGLLKIEKRESALLSFGGRILKYMWQTACMSISCQATCGVLAYFHFGTFPRFFLITNLIAIPLATVVMYSVVGTICASVFPGLDTIASSFLQWAIHLLNTAIRLLASL